MKKVFILLAFIAIAGCNKKDTTPTTTHTTTTVNNDTTIVQAAKWIKQKYVIQYNADGSEKYRTDFVYDGQGRIIDYQVHSNGKMAIHQRDYTYVSDEATYYQDQYDASGTNVISSTKVTIGYYNN